MSNVVVDSALSVLFLVAYTLLIPLISIAGIVPNILIVWVAVLAVRRGQFSAIAAGFLLGLAMDFLSAGEKMLGVASLSMSLGGFAGGFFYNENKTHLTLSTSRFLLVTATCAAVYSAVYFTILHQGTGAGWWSTTMRYGIGTIIYTTVAAVVPMFTFGRQG